MNPPTHDPYGAKGSEARAACRADAGSHVVSRATATDARGIAATLAEAFADYPFTSWTVQTDGRAERLRRLFSLTVEAVGIRHGDTYVVRCPSPEHDGAIVGAVVGLASDSVPDHVWTRLAEADEPLLGDRAGAAARADEATRHLRPTEPHYTIATMGVAPDHQGRGLALTLLTPALAAATEHGLPCYLETSTAANVRLYQRAGFTVSGQVALPDAGPRVWAMTRPVIPVRTLNDGEAPRGVSRASRTDQAHAVAAWGAEPRGRFPTE